jgi:hypothetical protein
MMMAENSNIIQPWCVGFVPPGEVSLVEEGRELLLAQRFIQDNGN